VSAIWAVRPEVEGDLIPKWDPNAVVGVSVQARVDRRGVLADINLGATAPLAVSLSWSSLATCSSGVLRSTSLTTSADAEEVQLWGEIYGAQLAGSVEVSLTLHLAASIRHEPESLRPWLVGSVLWREARTYFIEGDGARFPVEERDFLQSSFLPKEAAWYLDWRPDVPTDSFLGTVCLYLNSSHPRVKRLADQEANEDSELQLVRSLLRTDIARQLITGALASPEFVEGDAFEPGTVGNRVRTLISQVFPGRPVSKLAAHMRDRPHDFEALMQSRLRFLDS
jgi:hypothetical protein